ncbi:hypothetical protein SAMN06265338_1083 [Rhodoblastus acidophilus]|uniref:Uncharacterized protein n=1 Tax=Rhodoblastus acidophilus TaxID=1074 RepID=A0A212RVH1_RHOAC|nr:hypothetical protein [Rhodoblastus acidophilus]MCW2315126.1 putative membrane protein [Rhodoblastus acidophilus]PPQ35541.1 hypothetical protein CKO16_20465 [Rhodoblastus acidophilus]RAI18850.1 hypothetical protein CH337_13070 [Rhodoblastus acidophilus]SNB76691.1 hypothetical protein SAMN06265338_1083 [Rhodoblastus acidophilus]
MGSDAFDRIQGRLAALDLIVTQLAFRWGMTQSHPQTALADLMRPLEAQAAELAANPDCHRAAVEELQKTIQGMGQALEAGLQQEVLRRASEKSPGHA